MKFTYPWELERYQIFWQVVVATGFCVIHLLFGDQLNGFFAFYFALLLFAIVLSLCISLCKKCVFKLKFRHREKIERFLYGVGYATTGAVAVMFMEFIPYFSLSWISLTTVLAFLMSYAVGVGFTDGLAGELTEVAYPC